MEPVGSIIVAKISVVQGRKDVTNFFTHLMYYKYCYAPSFVDVNKYWRSSKQNPTRSK